MSNLPLVDVLDLLEKSNDAGIKISFDNDELIVNVQKDKRIEQAMLNELKEKKQHLIAYFKSQQGNETSLFSLTAIKVQKGRDNEHIPLSFEQERLWFIDQLEGSLQYHVPTVLRFGNDLNEAALAYALRNIVNRHEVLRTVIEQRDGHLYQRILEEDEWGLEVVDDPACRKDEEALQEYVEGLVNKPFDLSRDHKFRAHLIRLDNEQKLLVVTMHHIASDGWSVGIMVEEFRELYDSYMEGRPPRLKPIVIQYADYAIWQREHLSGEVFDRKVAYWKDQLKGVSSLNLLTDYPRSMIQNIAGGRVNQHIGKELTTQLTEFSRKEGATLYMTLLAVFKILLYRYSGQEDICIGSSIAGRQQKEIEGSIGFFTNTLALRSGMKGNMSMADLLGQVRQMALDGYEHQEVPFEKVVEVVGIKREPGRNPLFQVMFVLENTPGAGVVKGSIDLLPEATGKITSKFDLTLSIGQSPSGLQISVTYRKDLYKESTIDRLVGHYENLLKSIVDFPDKPIGSLNMLKETEKHQLLQDFNFGTGSFELDQTFPDLFEEQQKKTPDAIAIFAENGQLTYKELNDRAGQICAYLRKKGLPKEGLVAICMDRSPEIIAGLLGIMKAGAAYVPIDPEFPEDRIRFILEDISCTNVITGAKYEKKLQELINRNCSLAGVSVVNADTIPFSSAGEDELQKSSVPNCKNLAYLIYTSGSTGKPKGVMIEHKSLMDYVLGLRKRIPEIYACKSFALVSSMSADLGNTVVFSSLLSGGTLHLLSENTVSDATLFQHYFQKHAIDCLKIVPSHWAALCMEGDIVLPKQLLFFGGESLPKGYIERIAHSGSSCMIINHYGPTETTIGKLLHVVGKGEIYPGAIPIGKPFSNTRALILSKDLALCPVGTAGELYIGGDGLARGYMNRQDLTAERFIADPSGDTGAGYRLYKTGDLCRWLEDGNMEYLTREDDQVKIRGYRVEPGEIENVLQHTTLVRQSFVLGEKEKGRLVAYLVPRGKFDLEGILCYLKEKLPDYMIPSLLVELDHLPLTSNGKIDRSRLPMAEPGESANNPYSPPRNELEIDLAAIWQELLERERVGIHDDFFESGGHSLLAIRVISAIRKRLGKELSIGEIFEHPTIAAIGALLTDRSGQTDYLRLSARERPERIPLSFAQERLWFIDQLDGSVQYHIPVTLRLRGDIQKDALLYALRGIVNRHEVLRTIIEEEEGKTHQRVLEKDIWVLTEIEGPDFVENQPALLSLIRRLIDEPFDLSRDHKLRVHLIRLSETDHVLVAVLHHIASDGWSGSIMVEEFVELYGSFLEEERAMLSPLPVQYADYAIWQREYLKGEILTDKLSYWEEKLKGAEPLNLPTDYARPSVRSIRGRYHYFRIDKDLSEALQVLSLRQGATIFMTMLAAFKVLLYRYSGQGNITVGTVVANRNMQEVEGLIGFFVNMLALRSDLSDNPAFITLIERVKQTTLEAFGHQDTPFEKVVDQVVKDRDKGRNALFDVLFVLQNNPKAFLNGRELGGLEILPEPVVHETSKFDLTFTLQEGMEGLEGTVEYCIDLYKGETIARMLDHYKELLKAMVKKPDGRIMQVDILTVAERHQLLNTFNDTKRPYPESMTVPALFEAQAQSTPDHIALIFGEQQLTYRTLHERSNQLGHFLKANGVKEETLVAICIERSVELMVGILGVLKAGGAYVPIDPAYPTERIRYILEDTGASLIISSGKCQARIPTDHDCMIIALDKEEAAFNGEPVENVPNELHAGNLAYVMYTSGSTGKPKGVMVEHRNIVSLVMGMEYPEIRQTDILLVTGSISFDATTFEYWSMLLNGGQLVLCEESALMDGDLLKKEIQERQVNIMWFTSSWFNQLVDTDITIFEGLETILIGGDKLSGDHIRKIQEACPTLEIINGYGPTENTTFSLTYSFKEEEQAWRIPIGRPLSNRRAYILNGQQELCAVGIVGEICVGGAGLARGYLNGNELTAEKFIAAPFHTEHDFRLYKTGDLGRWLEDGNIEYIGRVDDQVKIRGYRIELGEIERVMEESGLVDQVVVLAKTDRSGNKRLVGYAVPGVGFGKTEIMRYLEMRLPEYMVPSLLIELERMPLTPNGKTDKMALPDPGMDELAFVAPRTEIEKKIAEIWQELLEVERVGLQDNFFELGGDSIRIINVVSRLRKAFYNEINIADVYESSDLEQLAALISNKQPVIRTFAAKTPDNINEEIIALKNSIIPVLPRQEEIEDVYPMSDIQSGMVYTSLLEPSLAIYHDQMIFTLSKNLEAALFERALVFLVEKHGILRTAFNMEAHSDGIQIVYKSVPVKVEYFDLSDASQGEASEFIQGYIRKERAIPFAVNTAPLWRAALFGLSDQKIFLFQFHHAILDGWSVASLHTELNNLYLSLVGKPWQKSLRPLSCSYRDFILEGIAEKRKEENEIFWKAEMSGYQRLELFTQEPGYHRLAKKYSEKYLRTLTLRTKGDNISLKGLFLGAYLYTISMLTYDGEVTLGLVSNNRPIIEDGDKLLGCFLNTIPFRFEVNQEEFTWRTYFEAIEAKLSELKKRDRTTLFQIAKITGERTVNGNPFFDTLFNFINFHVYNSLESSLSVSDLLKASHDSALNEGYASTNTYLDCTVNVTGNQLQVNFSSRKKLLSGLSLEVLQGYFDAVMDNYLEHYEERMGRHSVLSFGERRKIIDVYNDTRADYPIDKTLVELFGEQVERRPDAIAVVFEKEWLTYRNLDERSNQLACYLRKKGIREGMLVALCLERSLEMIIGIWGILKAGGAYVPIDPTFPAGRIGYLLEDTGIGIVLASGACRSCLPADYKGLIIGLDTEWEEITKEPTTRVAVFSEPHHIVYVIYTSGSTGRPKGVMIEHRGLVNRLCWAQQYYGLTEQDAVLQKTTYCFDVSVWELLWPLLTGAKLIFAHSEGHKDVDYLKWIIDSQKITVIHFVPSMLEIFLSEVHPGDCTTLKKILCSGEALKKSHVRLCEYRLPHAELHNLYGPTEASIDVTYWNTSDRTLEDNLVPIGKPIGNIRLFISNKYRGLSPIGVPGELWISGIGVARGYLNRPELTRERFPPDPFGMDPEKAPDDMDAGMYRTGDLCRWLPDGNIEYLGRIDEQVKIRGFRIEPGEVERVLDECGLVKQCAVVFRKDAHGEAGLVGYVVPWNGMEPEDISSCQGEILTFLKNHLPEYMIPSWLIILGQMPLTPNGKVDRKALSGMDLPGLGSKKYAAPETELEKQLVKIWQKVLSCEPIGIYDNFFELGGHSLTATRMVSAIRGEMELDLKIKDLFIYSTISRLASYLQGLSGGLNIPLLSLHIRPDRIPLSFAQERLWFIDQLEGSFPYHIPMILRMKGLLVQEALAYAFQEIVARHEVFRMALEEQDGKAFQRVMENGKMILTVTEDPVYKENETILQSYIDQLVRAPFDLARDNKLRVHLIWLSPQEWILVMVLHHIASDGWSAGILVKELVELYGAFVEKREPQLPVLRFQYADYAIWQRQYLSGALLQGKLDYWRRQLKGIQPLGLPTDYTRPAIQSNRGGLVVFRVEKEVCAGLQRLSQQEGVTLFMTFLAAFKILLYRYCGGQGDIAVGTVLAGRLQQEIEGLIGLFVNTLVLRTELGDNPDFITLLQRVKQTTLAAYENQEVPFEKVVEAVVKERDMSRNPLFDVLFVLQNNMMDTVDQDSLPGLELWTEKADHHTARFDMTFSLVESSDGWEGSVEYCKELFRNETIDRMVIHFKTLLVSIIQQPGQRIANLPLLSLPERRQLIDDFNDTKKDFFLDKSLTDIFAEQVLRSPDAVALVSDDGIWTYRELDLRSNQLGHYLKSKGIKGENLVAICLDRSFEMFVGLWGILKSGGAYLPIDPDYPSDRIRYMLEDAGVELLVTNSACRSRLAFDHHAFVIDLDRDKDLLEMESGRSIHGIAGPADLAYVLYTSGSTGQPKGVMVEHGSVVNYLLNGKTRYMEENGKVGGSGSFVHLSYTFDASLTALFMPLLWGKPIIIGSGDPMDVFAGENFLKYAPYDFIKLTPAHLPLLESVMQTRNSESLTGRLVVGGEALHANQVAFWLNGKTEIVNEYGPTEATVGCSVYRFCHLEEVEENNISIGKPIDNVRLYIVDAYTQPVPVGVTGELCIGGSGVSRGYLNRPELTAERFISDPFVEGPGRIYRTGDWCRWQADGNIVYLGRQDEQVKLRGYRVELGEISRVLEQSGQVRQAVVKVFADRAGHPRLAGFVVPEGSFDKAGLLAYLESRLPDY
ncbi:amino acid adenylation domain-containing protein, partial [Flavitalea flava]